MARRLRRSLSQRPGRCRAWGEPDPARRLAEILSVDPEAKLRFTHGFHAYPGRMHPDIAEKVLEAFPPKVRVLDPFVGSGTVAVEAVRRGIAFTGVDVSRVALEIAWVRTRIWVPDRCRRIEAAGIRIEKTARSHREETFPVPPWSAGVREWFHPQPLGEIGLVKVLIDEEKDEEVRRVLTCVLSSLLVKLSRQVSDSVTVIDESIRPWPRGTVFRFFREKCAELTKGLLLLSSDLHKRSVKPVEPEFHLGDARTFAMPAADLVLTSPPYPGTYDYFAHHSLRFALYGGREAAEKEEIGSRRDRAVRYREDLKASLENARRALVQGGRMVLLLGDGVITEARVRADQLVRSLVPVRAGATQDLVDWSHGRRGERRGEHLILVG